MTLVDIRALEAELQMSVPTDRIAAARSACIRATSIVMGAIPATEDALRADVTPEGMKRLAAIEAVAVGVALDIFGNPLSRSGFSGPEGLTFAATPRPRRGLFDSEQKALNALFLPMIA